jgi:iron complex outermembrane receptor protein
VDHNWGGLLRLEHTSDDGLFGWYAGIAQSVRNPDATERFIGSNGMTPSMRWVGNPNLAPEQHRQLEWGATRQWGALSLDVSLYHNQVDDFVLRDRALLPGNNANIYRNIEARLTGGEVQWTWTIDPFWSAQLGAAYTRAHNQTDDRPIAQIQPLEAFARVNWRRADWEVSASLQSQARQTRVDLDSSTGIPGQGLDVRQTPGWAVLNVTMSHQLSARWLLQAGVDNALNKDYSQHLNRANAFDPTQFQVDEPGRSLWLGLRVQL